MEHDQHGKKPRVAHTLATLMASFTALFTALGLAAAATAHVPLARHRVHGRDAVLLYKAVRWAGLVLAAIPYVVDVLLLLFLACLWCCKPAANRDPGLRPPPWTANGGEDALKEVPNRVPGVTGRLEWDAIRAPTYEYLAEVIRALAREDQLEGSRQGD